MESADQHRRKLLLITKVLAVQSVFEPLFLPCVATCFPPCTLPALMIAIQIMQTLGNRGKFGAKEAFMTVMISHLESLECSSRLDTFFNDILTVSLDDNALEAAPSAALDLSFPEDSLNTIRSFFCRQVSCCVLPRSPANRLHARIPLTCLSPRHSSAILTRLQRESISRACSPNEIVSRDRVFVATITDLQPNGIRLSPQTIQGMLRIIICMIIITIGTRCSPRDSTCAWRHPRESPPLDAEHIATRNNLDCNGA